MALTHEFILSVESNFQLDSDNNDHDGSVMPSVAIHHDFINYIDDSLKWVESCNLGNRCQPQHGLCLYGQTIFYRHQITHFKQVIEAWCQLFSCAPDRFELTGDWGWVEGENDSGDYERLSIVKTNILTQLNELIRLCQIVENEPNRCLIHHGI